MSTKLFRESALERLSSPEQLDQVLPTTSPRGWISLLALWSVLGSVVAWSVFGKVPVQERGEGIIGSGAGLKQVVATGTGRLKQVMANVGSTIEVGQVIAVIDKKDLEDQIAGETAKLDELQKQNIALDAFDALERDKQKELADNEREVLKGVVTSREQRVTLLRTRRKTLESSTVATRIELEGIDEDIHRYLLTVEESRLQISQLDARIFAAEHQRSRDHLTRELKIKEVLGQIDLLKGRLKREGLVASDVAGEVMEIRATEGAVVAMGAPILLVEPTDPAGRTLEAILYVSASTGKRLLPGMKVLLVPSTVKREEYGSLMGTVTEVASGATSREAMLRSLADPNLVQEFTSRLGVPKEIKVELTRDPSTVTGYKWTSVKGPFKPLSTGTLCEGWITIEERSPIDLVIPLLKGEPKS